MDEIDLDELRSWLREGGAIAQQYFNQVVGQRKADQSWVTEADLAIERELVARLARRYPRYGIIGEEGARHGVEREFLWALDPLDGTASFVAGLPIWGISLGLLRAGTPYFGIIYLPLLDDCYWAGPSGGAYLNEQPIQVTAPAGWDSEDWLATPSNAHQRFTIAFDGKTRNLGCTAAALCYVARGSAVGALITRAAIWDIAAGIAIARAAGATAIGLSGREPDFAAMLDGRPLPESIVVGAPAQAEALRAVIQEYGGSRRKPVTEAR